MVDELQKRREMKMLEDQAAKLFEAMKEYNVVLVENMDDIPQEAMELVRRPTS
jgi:hypothetical protein